MPADKNMPTGTSATWCAAMLSRTAAPMASSASPGVPQAGLLAAWARMSVIWQKGTGSVAPCPLTHR